MSLSIVYTLQFSKASCITEIGSVDHTSLVSSTLVPARGGSNNPVGTAADAARATLFLRTYLHIQKTA